MANESEIVSQMTIDDLFEGMNDFDLSDCISCAIEERYGYDHLMSWPASVPLEHRVVHQAWSTGGFLECEGYARFFNLDCDHSAFPQSIELLGLPELAKAIRESLRIAPPDTLGNTRALIDHFGKWDRLVELVDSTEGMLFEHSDAIQTAHARYVRQHKSAFAEMLPEIRRQRSFKEFVEAQSRSRSEQAAPSDGDKPSN